VSGAEPLLRCQSIDVSYGPVQVLFGVDMTVEEGELVALLGTNGAGKSTLLRAICGLSRPGRGTVTYDGAEVTGADPAELARRGIGFMPGGRGVFGGLSIAENLRMAGWLLRDDPAALEQAVEEQLVRFPVLAERAGATAGLLSGGQQQMLALANALVNRPRLLLIDELSLGLAPIVVGELLDAVRQLTAGGTTVVLVEQSVNIALELAERAVFMEKGEVRFTGPTAELVGRSDLLRSVFIGGAADRAERAPVVAGPVVLSARDLTKHFGGLTAVEGVELDVRAGEIVGIIGPNGAGKTTLLDLLAGAVAPDRGSVLLGDEDVTALGAAARAERGMARTFQDARLFPGLTVEESLAVALERFLVSRDVVAAALRLPASVLSEALAARQVDALVDALGLGAFGGKLASELSTGSRRVVELGSLVAQQGEVLLLDEPGAGLAQRETEAMAPLLRRLRDATGAALVVVEHDVPMLLAACDRLVAMELGRVIADGPPAEVVRDERVIASYLGTSDAAVARSGKNGARRRPTPQRGQPAGVSTGRTTASK
jgi:branched-chain amino acid transport system ATP-binding protein